MLIMKQQQRIKWNTWISRNKPLTSSTPKKLSQDSFLIPNKCTYYNFTLSLLIPFQDYYYVDDYYTMIMIMMMIMIVVIIMIMIMIIVMIMIMIIVIILNKYNSSPLNLRSSMFSCSFHRFYVDFFLSLSHTKSKLHKVQICCVCSK